MCVIIIKQKKTQRVGTDTLKRAGTINPDGLGIVWLDDFSITYHKSKDWQVLDTQRPYIAHFRYATKGKVGKSNTHPFQCGQVKHEFLMHNGTIMGLGSEEVCDSRMLAEEIGKTPRHTWEQALAEYDSRFVTINTQKRSFQVYNKHLWSKKDGVWYSKDSVLHDNYVAVYGTLKKGNSNYYSYLGDSTFVGSGKTKDKYPLVVSGLPFLLERKGEGHNVKVDVFKVSDSQLQRLDKLEGHPNWYIRKEVECVVGDTVEKCWIYFNPTAQDTKNYVESYEQYKSYGYNPYKGSSAGYGSHNNDWWGGVVHTPKKSKSSIVDDDWDWGIVDEAPAKSRTAGVIDKDAYCIYCYRNVSKVQDGWTSHYCTSCDTFLYKDEIIFDTF